MNALLDRLGIEGPKASFKARLADLTKASGRKFPHTQPEPKVEAARSTEGNQKPVGRESPRAHFRIPKG